ncbi:MAG: hypothetical protein WCD76_18185 [Pyrinomonadaceae bacterium]
MNPDQRLIFRPDAVHRYLRSRSEPVLPRFGRGASSLLLWALACLFIASGIVFGLRAKLPVYASGLAVTPSAASPSSGDTGSKRRLVVLLPPEFHSRLHAGQQINLRREAQTQIMRRQVLRGLIVAVEPSLSSPEAVRERYGLEACLVPGANEIAVALAEVEIPEGAMAEGTYRADVEVRARRIGAGLPFVGRLFDE